MATGTTSNITVTLWKVDGTKLISTGNILLPANMANVPAIVAGTHLYVRNVQGNYVDTAYYALPFSPHFSLDLFK